MRGSVIKRALAVSAALAIAAIVVVGSGEPTVALAQEGVASSSNPVEAGRVTFDHIFVIAEENHSYSDIVGNNAAPYLNNLASQYAVATNYYGISHPSVPNYLALTGGSTFGTTSDCHPSACPIRAPNLADRMGAAGKTWKAYMDSMPQPCTTVHNGLYTPRHDPFVYFVDIQTRPIRCRNHIVPYSVLAQDLNTTLTTPNFVWISPNVCNDMHDCSATVGDTWLHDNLPTIFNSPAWKSQRSVMFIVWDEASGGNHVPLVVVGDAVKPGYKSAVAYNHYNLLRTIEAAWGLATLTRNDAAAKPMSDFWK